MDKRITTSITYKLPILDYDFVKNILSEINETSQKLGKSEYWVPFIKGQINDGLKIFLGKSCCCCEKNEIRKFDMMAEPKTCFKG